MQESIEGVSKRSPEELRACNNWQIQLIRYWARRNPEMNMEMVAQKWISRYAVNFGRLFDQNRAKFVLRDQSGLSEKEIEMVQGQLDQNERMAA